MNYLKITLLLLCLFGGGSLFAQSSDEDKTEETEQPKTVYEQFSEIRSLHRESISELKREFRKASDDDERAALAKKRRAIELELAEKTIEVVNSSDEERKNIDALAWMVKYNKGDGQKIAAEHLLDNYLESKNLKYFVKTVGRMKVPSVGAENWLQKIIEKNPHDQVRAEAAIVKIKYLQRLAEVSEYAKSRLIELSDQPEMMKTYLNETWTSETCGEEVERLAEFCLEEFSDVKIGRSKVSTMAKRIIVQSQIRVGKVAPDIVGTDLDGREFKLSDYRGKVIMLDFWGDW